MPLPALIGWRVITGRPRACRDSSGRRRCTGRSGGRGSRTLGTLLRDQRRIARGVLFLIPDHASCPFRSCFGFSPVSAALPRSLPSPPGPLLVASDPLALEPFRI